ncbi:P-loop containing nucleoside triphosphate hydrolase protein [Chytriomyces sp. MP71]|nr:P-loop containing nucleoside triphosphate hydrolase protein [Chytriomyces sp. MP71]
MPAKASSSEPAPSPAIKRSPFYSYWSLSWLNPLLKVGRRTPLEDIDIPHLPPHLSASNCALSNEGSFWHQVNRHHQSGGKTKLPSLSAHVFPQLLDPKSSSSTPLFVSNGYALAAIMLAVQVVSAIADTAYHAILIDMEVQVRAILTNAVYQKTFRLSPRAQQSFSAGRVNQLVGTDMLSIVNMIGCIDDIWSIPLTVVVAFVFLSKQTSGSGSTGDDTLSSIPFIVVGIVNMLLGPFFNPAYVAYFVFMDQRFTKLREMLHGIKSIKFQALEEKFLSVLERIRGNQLFILARIISLNGTVIGLFQVQRVIAPLMTVLSIVASGGTLNPSVVFASLSLLSVIMAALEVFPTVFARGIVFNVSFKRLKAFLLAEEMDETQKTTILDAETIDASVPAITLSNACFSWEEFKQTNKTAKPTSPVTTPVTTNLAFKLNNVTLTIPRGALCAVVGPVGSGKSSLLQALIGEMRKTEGSAVVRGRVAYCTQEPWILSATLADNISFGHSSNLSSKAVRHAASAACLDADLQAMPHGLQTFVGEKGVTLSGGQRARVALARAIAADADVVFLDDPLSALDAHVGRRVFEDAICGALKGKTVVLVSHHLHLLLKADWVVVMGEGEVKEVGAFSDLMARPGGALGDIMKDYAYEEPGKEESEYQADALVKKNVVARVATTQSLEDMEAETPEREERVKGRVSLRTMFSYFHAGAVWFLPTVILGVLSMIGTSIMTKLTVTFWSGTDNIFKLNTSEYQALYTNLSIAYTASIVFTLISLTYCGFLAGKFLHSQALEKLFQAPISFFEAQPVGRILSRMADDVAAIDLEMPESLGNFLTTATLTLTSLVLIAYAMPYLLIQFAILIIVAFFIFFYFQSSYRELKRISSIVRSVLSAHVSETIVGASTIKAYNSQAVFVQQQHVKLDLRNQTYLVLSSLNLWLRLRLSLLGATVMFVVVAVGYSGSVNAALVGLSLSECFGLSDLVLTFLGQLSTLEASFNSVERLNHYVYNLPQEAPRNLPTDPKQPWPVIGTVEFKAVTLSYPSRPDHYVIKNLNISVRAGEKIGIVGKTGSGKSTLMSAVFRVLELTAGFIFVDGLDITQMGLKSLRTHLQMIPQDPVLFQGTIRTNLNLIKDYSDEELWRGLELVGLSNYVSNLDLKLDHEIDENGNNLSLGQRQLICLCRAILARPRILVMDEATAAIDRESDLRIQRVLESHFQDTTVLCIAHKIGTIAGFDRVLVLENGNAAEFDTPSALLEQEGSLFNEMVNAAGNANASAIREIAFAHK